MALKATIFKAELQVSDLDRSHFATHLLTLARHPSETDERMMVRVLAFALNAVERLEFGRGLSSEDEADLVLKDLTGAIDTWIDVGLPDERRVRKASGRADNVRVYTYGGRAAEMWWNENGPLLARLDNLEVFDLPTEATRALAKRVGRSMELSCTIQDGHVYFEQGGETLEITPVRVKERRAR
jgi:uncharacterized protein YaeQ